MVGRAGAAMIAGAVRGLIDRAPVLGLVAAAVIVIVHRRRRKGQT